MSLQILPYELILVIQDRLTNNEDRNSLKHALYPNGYNLRSRFVEHLQYNCYRCQAGVSKREKINCGICVDLINDAYLCKSCLDFCHLVHDDDNEIKQASVFTYYRNYHKISSYKWDVELQMISVRPLSLSHKLKFLNINFKRAIKNVKHYKYKRLCLKTIQKLTGLPADWIKFHVDDGIIKVRSKDGIPYMLIFFEKDKIVEALEKKFKNY